MCPKIWCDKYNANFFWTKPGLSISRQAINYWQMRSLQRGASPSDQGRTFACRQRRTKCIQFRYALPWRPKHGPPESYETMGSIHRRPGLKDDQGRRRPRQGLPLPWKTCPHPTATRSWSPIWSSYTYTWFQWEQPLLPEINSIMSVFWVITLLALVYGYQKSHVYMLIFHASHRFRVICWHVYVWLLTPFFDTCQGRWFLWRGSGRFERNQKAYRVGVGRWSPSDGPEGYALKMLICPLWCSADGELPMKSRKEKRIQTLRKFWWEEDPDSTKILMIRL